MATNGLDALQAVDADRPVLAEGFPTPTNVLLSSGGRRLGAVNNGGRLADETVTTPSSGPACTGRCDEAAARGSVSVRPPGWSGPRPPPAAA